MYIYIYTHVYVYIDVYICIGNILNVRVGIEGYLNPEPKILRV